MNLVGATAEGGQFLPGQLAGWTVEHVRQAYRFVGFELKNDLCADCCRGGAFETGCAVAAGHNIADKDIARGRVSLRAGRQQIATGVDLSRDNESEDDPHIEHVRRLPRSRKCPTPHKEGKQCPA